MGSPWPPSEEDVSFVAPPQHSSTGGFYPGVPPPIVRSSSTATLTHTSAFVDIVATLGPWVISVSTIFLVLGLLVYPPSSSPNGDSFAHLVSSTSSAPKKS